MKGKKRKGAKEPKQPNPKQPKPKPKRKPDDLRWVGPVSPQGRALKERLKEAANSRIQVVKCYLKGFIRGRNNVKNKIVAHLRLRMGIHHKQRKLVSLAVLVLLAKCMVGPPSPGFHPAPPPPSVQPPPAQGAAPLDPLPGSLAAGPAAGPAQPAWQPKLQERSSSRLASRRPLPPAPVPPQPLNILDPLAAHNVKEWTEEFAKPNELSGWKQIMRGPAHRQNLRPIPKAFFADPDNAAITAKLVELDKTELLGDSNTIGHLAKQMAVSTQEMFANPERYVKLWAKAARTKYGITLEVAKLFVRVVCQYGLNYSSSELRGTPLESPEWQECMAYHRHVLTGVLEDVEEAAAPADSAEPEDPDAPPAITKLPLHRRILYAIYVNRCLEEWQDPNPPAPPPKGEGKGKGKGRGRGKGKGKGKGRGKGPRVPHCPPPFILTPMAGSGTHFIEIGTRVLHGVCSQLGLTTATAEAFEADHAAYSHWDRVFKVGKLANRGFVFDRRILTDGVSVCVQYTRPLDYTPPGPSGSSPAAGTAADPPGSSQAADPPGPSGSSPAAGTAADPPGSSQAADPPGPSGSSPAAADPFDSNQATEDPSDSSSSNKRTPSDIGSGLADERAFLFDPATQMGMGLDPGAIQAVSAASGMWDAHGLLQGFYRSKLTRSQVQHDSGLIQARRNTQRWNDNIKLELQHLAAATPAGTSLVAIQKHVAVTLATWDAVWGEYLHPKWAEQRMRLHGAQETVLERYFMKLEEEAAMMSQQEWGTRKQLVVFFGNAGIGTRGGWGAKAVLQACRKVVERPNSGGPTDRVKGKVVTVDEFRTSRVSSILNSPQPCEEELDSSKPTRLEGWKPKPGQVQDRLLRSAWSKRFEAPVRGLMWCPYLAQATPGNLGKWVDRDCNSALNLQRAGEAKWRPLELCRWQHRGRLPAQGKEYPALGFKKLRERAPKAQAQQPVAHETEPAFRAVLPRDSKAESAASPAAADEFVQASYRLQNLLSGVGDGEAEMLDSILSNATPDAKLGTQTALAGALVFVSVVISFLSGNDPTGAYRSLPRCARLTWRLLCAFADSVWPAGEEAAATAMFATLCTGGATLTFDSLAAAGIGALAALPLVAFRAWSWSAGGSRALPQFEDMHLAQLQTLSPWLAHLTTWHVALLLVVETVPPTMLLLPAAQGGLTAAVGLYSTAFSQVDTAAAAAPDATVQLGCLLLTAAVAAMGKGMELGVTDSEFEVVQQALGNSDRYYRVMATDINTRPNSAQRASLAFRSVVAAWLSTRNDAALAACGLCFVDVLFLGGLWRASGDLTAPVVAAVLINAVDYWNAHQAVLKREAKVSQHNRSDGSGSHSRANDLAVAITSAKSTPSVPIQHSGCGAAGCSFGASRSAQGKQRQERRDGWNTSRRQVIKVSEGAVLRGCKKTKRKLRAHLQLRAEVLNCTPSSAAPDPPAVQPPQAPDAPPLPPLPPRAPAQPAPAQPASMELDGDYDSESDCESEPESPSDSESEPEPEPVTQPTPRRSSARLAALAPAAPSGPPVPLDCEDPVMLRQLKDFCEVLANPNFKTIYNQLQRRLVRPRQHRNPMLMGVFEDSSNQALLAKLQELGNISLRERTVKLYAKAARARLGWSGEEAQLFIKMACGYGINAQSSELQAANLDKRHVADLIKEANKHRRLLGMKQQGWADQGAFGSSHFKASTEPPLGRWFNTGRLANKGFEFERMVETDGVSVCVHYTRPLPPPPAPPPAAGSSNSCLSAAVAAAHAVGLPHIGKGIAEPCEFVFDPATQIGVGIDPGVTQAVSAASGVWDERAGQLIADQLARWKLTKGQVKHDSGLNNARRATQR
ncbi:hypothetical protein QJQ45_007236 [Haematococcus lacustris]|nr:hypothetical protein QJQ45_007236 [Haematococcus lacustris]